MKLKQINKGHKCPNCKLFGLKPMTILHSIYYEEREGHNTTYQGDKFYRCNNCYAEFIDENEG